MFSIAPDESSDQHPSEASAVLEEDAFRRQHSFETTTSSGGSSPDSDSTSIRSRRRRSDSQSDKDEDEEALVAAQFASSGSNLALPPANNDYITPGQSVQVNENLAFRFVLYVLAGLEVLKSNKIAVFELLLKMLSQVSFLAIPKEKLLDLGKFPLFLKVRWQYEDSLKVGHGLPSLHEEKRDSSNELNGPDEKRPSPEKYVLVIIAITYLNLLSR